MLKKFKSRPLSQRMYHHHIQICVFIQEPDSRKVPFLGEKDQRLALHILNSQQFHGSRLVPEHVETRSLYNPLEPNMTQVRKYIAS